MMYGTEADYESLQESSITPQPLVIVENNDNQNQKEESTIQSNNAQGHGKGHSEMELVDIELHAESDNVEEEFPLPSSPLEELSPEKSKVREYLDETPKPISPVTNQVNTNCNIKDQSSGDQYEIEINEKNSPAHQRTKGHQVFIGNLTWWTSDQDIFDALIEIGVKDFIEIVFFDNRANGQSKGYCLLTVGSLTSLKLIHERFAKKQFYGKIPFVIHPSKLALNHLETFANTPSESDAYKEGTEGLKQKSPKGIGNENIKFVQNSPGNKSTRGRGTGMTSQSIDYYSFEHCGSTVYGHASTQISQPGVRSQIFQPIRYPPDVARMSLHPVAGHPSTRPIEMGRPPPLMTQALNFNSWNCPTTLSSSYSGGGLMPPFPERSVNHVGIEMTNFPHPQLSRGPPILVPLPHMNPAFLQQYSPPGPILGHYQPFNSPVLIYGLQDEIATHCSILKEMEEEQVSPTTGQLENVLTQNKKVSSSAISRALSDVTDGNFCSAIETLEMAISIIKKSRVADDGRCVVLINILKDTLDGIFAKSVNNEKEKGSRPQTNSRSLSRSRSRSQTPSHSHRCESRPALKNSRREKSKSYRCKSGTRDNECWNRSRYRSCLYENEEEYHGRHRARERVLKQISKDFDSI